MTTTLKRIAVFYFFVSLLFAGELLLAGRSLFRWDALVYNWPMVLETRAQILSGHWPFWAASFCNGTPLLENINAGVLYPPRVLLWFLPLKLGYHLFLFFHVWLSFVAMHLFLSRGLRLRGWAPFAGALVYGASGYMRGMWDTHNFMALPWIPLGLATLLDPRWRVAVIGTAVCWSMMILGGDFQAACLWPGAALLLILLRPGRGRLLVRFVFALVIALGLTAAQWLPALDASRESYRAGGLAMKEALERSFHPLRLVDLVIPYFFGNRDTWHGMNLMGEGATKLSPWTCSIHMGILSLVLLAFSLRGRRKAWALVLTLGGILLSFGRFLPGYELWQSLPVISSFRYPEKYLLWATLGLATLVGLGASPALAWLRKNKILVSRRWLLAAVFLVSLLIPWYREHPTTRAFDPLSPPLVVQTVRSSDDPQGRVLRDPALKQVPLPPGFAALTTSEKQSVFYKEALSFNTPRLWGCRTADGFSPAEPGAMRNFRLKNAVPDSNGVPEVKDLAKFCRLSSVAWLLTTPERLDALRSVGLGLARYAGWGEPESVVLARIPIPENGIWRPRPGVIRADFATMGQVATLRVSETYARGWRATDQHGAALQVRPVDDAFIGVELQAGTSQVRLRYEPRLWRYAAWISACALLFTFILSFRMSPGLAACALFVLVGLAARSHWSCTFDEGFHVARGVARIATGDARLSYFHPPLQNMACGYFAWLAHGDRVRLPTFSSDVWDYSVDLAAANADVFPDLIRASRWGTLLFSLLLILVGARWGGWLAALGLALNPALLAHGNLSTTDMGVTALAVAGTFALARERDGWALILFTLSALTKFTGLIWLGAFLLIVVPARRKWWLIPAGAALFCVLLSMTYGGLGEGARIYWDGLTRQTDHALSGHRAFFHGQAFTHGSWWQVPASIALKTPLLWILAMAAAGLAFSRKLSRSTILPYVPALAFVLLLVFANKMSIGVRHALPVIALGIIGAAVWVSGLKKMRAAAATALLAASVCAALFSFPNYISYFPFWAGGVQNGHRWLVDSNYDWGQEADVLESSWAELTEANNGRPLALVYFGFVDPALIYHLRLGPHSYGGFMSYQAARRSGNVEAWKKEREVFEGPTAASISALELSPHGIGFGRLREGKLLGRVSDAYFLFDPP